MFYRNFKGALTFYLLIRTTINSSILIHRKQQKQTMRLFVKCRINAKPHAYSIS
jgi:hypothetical protein